MTSYLSKIILVHYMRYSQEQFYWRNYSCLCTAKLT